MPLSTSSSELCARTAKPYAWAAAATILSLILGLASLELVTRVGFRRISRIESRTAKEYRDAANLLPGARENVLFLGNSLLLEGLDYDRIRHDLDSHTAVTRYVIEGTHYLEWYYGIRRLLAEGSKPDLIVLCLSPLQLIDGSSPNDYTAFYMLDTSDIPSLARVTHASLTKASSWLFARYSLFYAGRNNIRNFVLNRAFPAYGEFLHEIRLAPGSYPSSETLERVAEERLRALQEQCARYRVRFALLIPPAESTQGEPEVLEAGRRSDAFVWRPIPGGTLDKAMFTDGFHLNNRGAAILTKALEEGLKAHHVGNPPSPGNQESFRAMSGAGRQVFTPPGNTSGLPSRPARSPE